MDRKFYSTGGCPYNCKYCFVEWDKYKKRGDIRDAGEICCDIAYPSHDTEFFEIQNFLSILKEMYSKKEGYLITSISSKKSLERGDLAELADFNKELIDNEEGFIKISITFTNKSRIQEIEPGTATYKERVNNLKILSDLDIPRSIIFKPILPFISLEEYKEIIRDTSKYSGLYLLGSLYLEEDSGFFKNYIEGKFQTEEKTLKWMNNKSIKAVKESKELKDQISDIIKEKGLKSFESDRETLKYIKETIN